MTDKIQYCKGCNRMVRDIEIKLCSNSQYCHMQKLNVVEEEVTSEKEFLSEHDNELENDPN